MSQPVLLKVYAGVAGATPEFARAAEDLCRTACPPENAVVLLNNGTLSLSFEGVWFPVAEFASLVGARPDLKGKLDALDLENWRLTRYQFQNGVATEKSAPLNDVLAYSGH